MAENENTIGGTTTKAPASSQQRTARNNVQNFFEYGKIPPQALELEEAVLGAVMLEQNALSAVVDFLKPDIFYTEAHKKIYEAIHTLFGKSQPVDLLTVTQELKRSGNLDIAGGAYYVAQLTRRVASAANVEVHSRIITQKYIQRRLIEISSEINRDAYEDSMDVFDMLDMAEQKLFQVSENNFRRDYSNMSDLVKEAIKGIEAAKSHDGTYRGVPSGFSKLDRVTAGWQKSDLIVIAARPGMGKTAFVLSMARNISVGFKRPVAIFSLEMAAVQLVTRLIAAETMLSADKLKKGELKEFEWQQLNSRISSLVDAPLFIDDTPALSIFELRAKARRMKQQYKIELIIIDYIQLMQAGDNNKGNREQEISNISRSLKSLAKELDIPIIALSQLNRSVETRGGLKKPILSDLRESGAIEQDADMVLFIYRPEYYKIENMEDNTPSQGKAEIIIAKHRNGALEDIRLRFIAQYAQFTDDEDFGFSVSDQMAPNHDFENNVMIRPSKMNNDYADDDFEQDNKDPFGNEDLSDDGFSKNPPF